MPAIMPTDWLDRAKPHPEIAPPGVEIIVPDINDIALAKLVAWRDKDIVWLVAGVRSLILRPARMRECLDRLPTEIPAAELDRRVAHLEASLSN